MAGSSTGEETLPGRARGYDVTGGGLPPQAQVLAPGTRIASFVVEKKLGAGAMGMVYLARDTDLGRPVALKLLTSRDPNGQQRLLREAQAAAQLSHPNVVAVHQAGMWEEQVFLVMEYVDAGTLREWVAAAPRTPEQVLEAFTQAGRGLAAAHAIGLVHRDFKPDNVLVGSDGRVRVSDFGLVGVAGDTYEALASASGASSLDVELTRTGAILGTPAYMAPEQFEGARVDARADQFAFCVALFEALYGQRPYAGDTPANLIYAITHGEMLTPAELRVHPSIHRSIVRGLAGNPDARHPSVEALLRALEPPLIRSHTAAVVGGIAGLAALGGGIALAVTRPWEGGESSEAAAGVAEVDCDAQREHVRSHWTDERRESITNVIDSTGFDRAEELTATILAQIDGYVGALADMRHDACRAALIDERESQEELELRRHCIDDRLLSLDSVIAALEKDPELSIGASEVIVTLDSVQECGNLAVLRSAPPPSTDPAKLEQVAALRGTWATAVLLYESGRYIDAHVVAETGVETARELGDRPTLLRFLLEKCRAESELARSNAKTVCDESINIASDLGDRRREAMATVLRLFSPGMVYDERSLETELSDSKATVERVSDPRVGVWYDLQRSLLASSSNRPQAAIEHAEAALAGALAIEPLPVTLVARAEAYRAALYLRDGHKEDAERLFKSADDRIRQNLGPEHPDLWMTTNGLGQLMVAKGETQPGLEAMERALDMFENSHGRETPLIHWKTALARYRQQSGFVEPARKDWNEVIELAEEIVGKNSDLTFEPHRELVRLELGAQRFPEARAHVEALREFLSDTSHNKDPRFDAYFAQFGGQELAVAKLDKEMGDILQMELNWKGAAEVYLRSRERVVAAIGGESHADVAMLDSLLGNTYVELDECEKALQHFDKAMTLRNELGMAPDEFVALVHVGRAHCGVTMKDYEAAEAALGEVESILRHFPAAHGDGPRAYAHYERARLYIALGRTADARVEVDAAVAGFRALGGAFLSDAEKAEALLPP